MGRNAADKDVIDRFLEIRAELVGFDKKYRFDKEFLETIGLLPQHINPILNYSVGLTIKQCQLMGTVHNVSLDWLIAGLGNKYLS